MPQPRITNAATPAALGYTMPAEWEKHEATWLGWPHNASDWPGKFETIPWVYGEMVRKISAGEKIVLTNRGWTRDTGPIFVKKSPKSKVQSPKSETAIVHFHFNGWAKYNNWRKDTKVPETAARILGKKLFHAKCISEGRAPRVPKIERGSGTRITRPSELSRNFVIEGGGIE
jgi:agmatine/peptidylarginine deiminase